MQLVRDNWLVLLLSLIILILLAVIVRLVGFERLWRIFLNALPLRRSFKRAYLDLLLNTLNTTSYLGRGDSIPLDLRHAFAHMRVQVAGAPEPASASGDNNYEQYLSLGGAWYARVVQRWRDRNQSSQPATTPGGTIWREPRLVIRGKPGSGKTTLLKHIAITCARQLRGKDAERQPDGARAFAGTREIYGWPRPLFPIYIPLRGLARAAPDCGTTYLLDSYECNLGAIFNRDLSVSPGWFRRQFRQGGCLVLIDGFDELRDERQRNNVADRIRELAEMPSRHPNYIVVSTRPIGYEGQLNKFAIRELAPLNAHERKALVRARYGAIHQSESNGRRLDWQPREKADRLIVRLEKSDSLIRLASNPLMLGLIVDIYHRQEDGELPEKRYAVYELAVEYLTERWEIQRSQVAREERARSGLSLDEKRALAAGLAWAMFTQPADPARRHTAAREQLESYLLISRDDAHKILAQRMEPILSARTTERGPALELLCRKQALEWLTDLNKRGGLLQGESNDDSLDAPIQFAHKSIQEYLAAQAVAGDDTYFRFLLSKWDDDDWREVLLLYAASQPAESLIRHLMRQATPRAHLLAGWCLCERPKHALPLALQDEVRAAVRPLLYAPAEQISAEQNQAALAIFELIAGAALDRPLLEQIARQAISPIARARAVELAASLPDRDLALQQLLAEVATRDDDYRPRLAAGWALAEHDPRYDGAGWLPELVSVPAGRFLMGSAESDTQALSDEQPQHPVDLPAYCIGKTPVTNAQWRRFVDAGGYTTRAYWSDAGWHWRTGAEARPGWRARLFNRRSAEPPVLAPEYWDDSEFNAASQPVVGISWYEAVAYCRWLSAESGQAFYLPSEAEWEYAARGPNGSIYPWGDVWQAGCCNSAEAGLGRPSPVGSFPAGVSPYGALDMAGNVWEWCATRYGKPYPYDPSEDEWSNAYCEGDAARCVRGGAYYSDQPDVRGASRDLSLSPRTRSYVIIGLRVASRSGRPHAES